MVTWTRGRGDPILEVFELGAAEFAARHVHSKPSVDGSSYHSVSGCSQPLHRNRYHPVSQMQKLSPEEVTQLASRLTTRSGSKDGTVVKFTTPSVPGATL